MSIPKDLAKKRDEFPVLELSGFYDETDLYKSAFNAGVFAAFESEHVKALVEALNKMRDLVMLPHQITHDELESACNQAVTVRNEALAKWESRND